MKLYIIWMFFVITIINGMEQPDLLNDRELYLYFHHKQDIVLAADFVDFLQQNSIQTKDKTILNIGCSTGFLAAALAQNATSVHGISANKDMITFAQNQYNSIANLSFEYCSIPHFKSPKLFQLAVIDSCIDTIKNKEYIFQCANNNLEINGELFTTMVTSHNILPLNLQRAAEIILPLQEFFPSLTKTELIDLIIPTFPSCEEIHAILQKTGFECITIQEQQINVIRSEDDCFDRCILNSCNNPIFDFFTSNDEITKAYLLTEYISYYISKLKRITNNKFIEPLITTIIHARKVKK